MIDKDNKQPKNRWMRELIVGTLVTTTFSLLLTFILYVTGDYRFPAGLRTLGSDLGMRIFAEPALQPDKEFFKADAPFVFIDVDYAACEKLKEPDQPKSICQNPAKPPLQILNTLVQWASRSDARVIVLDFQLPDDAAKLLDPKRYETFSQTLKREDGPIVIAPAPLRPSAKPQHLILAGEDSLDDIGRDGRLRLAAFVAWNDVNVGDGVVRDYPPLVFVDETTQAGELGYLPSAPFLTAMLAETGVDPETRPADLADSLFYGGTAPCDAYPDWIERWSNRAGSKLEQLCDGDTFQLSDRRRERLMFSIHSLAALPEIDYENDATPGMADIYKGSGTVEGGMLYRHYFLSDFFGGDSQEGWGNLEQAVDLSSQIVVIGTSSIAGYDWHATPLGQMSGAEVIINATHAYSKFADSNLMSPSSTWWKATLTQLGVAVAIAVALGALVSRFVPVTSKDVLEGRATLASACLVAIIKAVIFLIGFIISIFLAAWITYGIFAKKPDTVVLDFLTPILSVFFVEMVVLSAMILALFTVGYEWLFGKIGIALSSVKAAKNTKEELGGEDQ